MTALATQSKTVNPSTSLRASLKYKTKLYWPLTKPLQSGLLLATGLAGYMSARCPIFSMGTLLGLAGSLFLAIAGSTVLNMWWDRDIDAKMGRTKKRPTSSGQVTEREVLRLGLILSIIGERWAVAIGASFGLIVFAGCTGSKAPLTSWASGGPKKSISIGWILSAMPILAG